MLVSYWLEKKIQKGGNEKPRLYTTTKPNGLSSLFSIAEFIMKEDLLQVEQALRVHT